MAEQANNQRQQSSSYPSGYPSPSLQASYSYPPPASGNSAEPYRASPTASGPTLPPISSIDGQAQQRYPQQPSQQGSPLPPPVAPMNPHYPAQPQPIPPQYYAPPGVAPAQHALSMRYQLPPQGDQRIMSGGRHKKEIKRRTKTGCLTCRKRRIKCDEAHPICRNCQKSKRECLGYDPIFKTQPGPAQIQPAPSGSPTPAAASATQLPAQPRPNHVDGYGTNPGPASGVLVPQGYAPAASGGHPGYAPATGPSLSRPEATEGAAAYDLGAAIDPALAGAVSGGMSAYNQQAAGGNANPYSTAPQGQPLKVKPLKVDDLFEINGAPVPPLPTGSDAVPKPDILKLYSTVYAPLLDLVMDTRWYSEKAPSILEKDTTVRQTLAGFKIRMDKGEGKTAETLPDIKRVETKMVWQFLTLCRSPDAAVPEVKPEASANSTETGANGTTTSSQAGYDRLQIVEVRKRLDVIESLLTGTTLESNPILSIPYQEPFHDQHKYWEVEFWKLLGAFSAVHGDTLEPTRERDNILANCRQTLSQLENRDVLYSIAIARHVGTRISFPPVNYMPATNVPDDNDEKKVAIAQAFLRQEAHTGQHQVISRISDMAVRSWELFR